MSADRPAGCFSHHIFNGRFCHPSETIEHIPDQFFLFTEVTRILKLGGRLFLTTQNSSSLRSRFLQFMNECDRYGIAPPNETTAYVEWGKGQRYLGNYRIRATAVSLCCLWYESLCKAL